MKKGISLVALIITIIVLIILTSGVIMLAGGENGIIGRAQRAVEANNETVAREKLMLEISTLKIDALTIGKNVVEYMQDQTTNLTSKGIEYTICSNNQIILFEVDGKYEIITDKNGNETVYKEAKDVRIGQESQIINLDGNNTQIFGSVSYVGTVPVDAKYDFIPTEELSDNIISSWIGNAGTTGQTAHYSIQYKGDITNTTTLVGQIVVYY